MTWDEFDKLAHHARPELGLRVGEQGAEQEAEVRDQEVRAASPQNTGGASSSSTGKLHEGNDVVKKVVLRSNEACRIRSKREVDDGVFKEFPDEQ